MTDTMTNKEAIDILRVINPPRENKRIFDKFMQARDMAIKALEKQKENRWIPVTEKFPEDDCECCVTVKGDRYKWVGTCSWNKYRKRFEEWDAYQDGMKLVSGVTAWKPIEEPYAEE